jgi:hypothetical protein
MSRTIKKICIVEAIVIAALLVKTMMAAPQSVAGNAPQTTSVSAVATTSQPTQVFELRIYTATEGKMELLHKRFRDHTLRLFEKYGIKNIGHWTASDEREQKRLYYLVAYPDRASREKMLINGVAVDPEFRKAVSESEKEGKLATKIESVVLYPTDYSPLK